MYVKGRLPTDDAERFFEERYSQWKAFMGKHIHSKPSLQVHVKGRLPTDDAERFFEELRRSRRRTCSIAIIRSVNEAP